jgi:antitoxin component HigA of HigAB toxin-antitoxin module
MRNIFGTIGGNSHVCHPCPRNPRRLSALRRFVPLGVLRSEKDYRKAVAILDEIIDEIGQDEAHPLADLAEALALFIHTYEETHAKIREARGPEVLRSLMEAHGLTQSELPEIGSRGGRVRNSLRRTRTQHSTDPPPGETIRSLPCRLHRSMKSIVEAIQYEG